MARNIVWESTQRTNEYSQGQYYGSIDLLQEAEKQTRSLRDIQSTITKHYRDISPELFQSLDSLKNSLSRASDAAQSSMELEKETLEVLGSIETELTNVNHTLEHGFELLALRIDETNSILQDIRDIFLKPDATKASESLKTGLKHLKVGLYEEAEHYLAKAVELDLGNYIAWYLIALTRSEGLGDYEGAVHALDRCDRYSSKWSKTYYSRSLTQRAMLVHSVEKNVGEAIDIIKRAIDVSFEAKDSNLQAIFLLAKLCAENGDSTKATGVLSALERVSPAYVARASNCRILVSTGVYDTVVSQAIQRNEKLGLAVSDALSGIKPVIADLDKAVKSSFGLDELVRAHEELMENYDTPDYALSELVARRSLDTIEKAKRGASSAREQLAKFEEEVVESTQTKLKQNSKEIEKRASDIEDRAVDVAMFVVHGTITVLIAIFLYQVWKEEGTSSLIMAVVVSVLVSPMFYGGGQLLVGFVAIVTYWLQQRSGKSKLRSLQAKTERIGEQELASKKELSGKIRVALLALTERLDRIKPEEGKHYIA